MTSKTPNPVDVHAGFQLKRRRQHLKLSQTALAESLGITFQQVQKYEKGVNRISSSRLQQIATILKVPVAYFFENDAPKAASGKLQSEKVSISEVSSFLAAADGQALARAFVRIQDRRLRHSIYALIDALRPN